MHAQCSTTTIGRSKQHIILYKMLVYRFKAAINAIGQICFGRKLVSFKWLDLTNISSLLSKAFDINHKLIPTFPTHYYRG